MKSKYVTFNLRLGGIVSFNRSTINRGYEMIITSGRGIIFIPDISEEPGILTRILLAAFIVITAIFWLRNEFIRNKR